jgi:hypothetical protein
MIRAMRIGSIAASGLLALAIGSLTIAGCGAPSPPAGPENEPAPSIEGPAAAQDDPPARTGGPAIPSLPKDPVAVATRAYVRHVERVFEQFSEDFAKLQEQSPPDLRQAQNILIQTSNRLGELESNHVDPDVLQQVSRVRKELADTAAVPLRDTSEVGQALWLGEASVRLAKAIVIVGEISTLAATRYGVE